MPPISEKRSPPILKDNIKENLSNSQALCEKLNGRVPDLHEYRESWLQEIELCKDQVRTQMLTQHNHLHTPEGCQYDGVKSSIEELKRRIRTRSESDSNETNKNRSSEDETTLPLQISSTVTNGLALPPSVKNPPLDSLVVENKSTRITSQTQLIFPTSSSTFNSCALPLNGFEFKGIVSETIEKSDGILNGVESTEKLEIDSSRMETSKHDANSTSSSPTNLKTDIPSVSNKSENEGSDLEDEEEFDEFSLPDGSNLSDSDDEYTGHVYLNTSDCKLDTYTDATSLPSSESNYFTPSSPFSPSLFPNVPAYLTFSSHAEKGPPVPPEVHRLLKWKLTSIMPKVVRRVVANSGFRLIKKTNDWMGTWEKHMKSPGFRVLRSYQKYNHLPGSFKIGRKDSVWRNLKSHMGKHGKKEFGFMQKTYILPQDLASLKTDWPKYSVQNTKWIIKPPASARGTGIKIVNRWTQIPKNMPLIVQKYIERPLLINGSKFDLRLYVIVTSVNPLRVYIHTDGLARFASVRYSDKLDTLDDRCMHLTNYSINKFSESYAINEDVNACQGHKWTLRSLWTHFREQGINTKRLWGKIRNIILRTLLAGESGLNRMFKTNVRSRYNCFELFGFDILLDEQLTPWLLEVNISPSLHSDQPLDLHVKGPLIQSVLNTAMYQVPPKLSQEKESEIAQMFNLPGKICLDKRLHITQLSSEEIKKHNYFTSANVENREDYLERILEDLTSDDIRCLVLSEDEFARSSPLERIFPGPCSYAFLPYIDFPRYYNRLLDAWEYKYGKNRQAGIERLQKLCEAGVHLQVAPGAVKEPSVDPQPPKTTAHSCEKEQQTTGAEICNNLDDPTFFEKEIESDEDISKKVTQTTLNGVINTCICDEKSVSNDIVMEHIQSTSILVETK
ncbi:tubulin polyglutamylase TTLL4-like isoform X3 [Hermetia illucens]|uniref:tubulin polyglutamylase TTLL4-like isoform X3 n=1 Tax=Hermetia illucens TaxID=343691 RepID=UPI0018CC0CD0|nr:tubulin polyglutamylase TTLL4-like isoform X3 [Hermetia illucens]